MNVYIDYTWGIDFVLKKNNLFLDITYNTIVDIYLVEYVFLL